MCAPCWSIELESFWIERFKLLQLNNCWLCDFRIRCRWQFVIWGLSLCLTRIGTSCGPLLAGLACMHLPRRLHLRVRSLILHSLYKLRIYSASMPYCESMPRILPLDRSPRSLWRLAKPGILTMRGSCGSGWHWCSGNGGNFSVSRIVSPSKAKIMIVSSLPVLQSFCNHFLGTSAVELQPLWVRWKSHK